MHDLRLLPWPIESASVAEARCSHYFEHVPRLERPGFMSELWRVLGFGARAVFQTPLGLHRQFQDFTHEWPVFPESYCYFDRDWLRSHGLGHYVDLYGIACNFKVVDTLVGVLPEFDCADAAAVSFAAQNYVRGGADLLVTLEKVPL